MAGHENQALLDSSAGWAPSDETSGGPLLEHGPVVRHSQSGVDLVAWQLLRLAEHLGLASYFGCLIGWIGFRTGSVIYWEIYSVAVPQ